MKPIDQNTKLKLPISNNPSNLPLEEEQKPMYWSQNEDKILIEKAKEYNFKNWASVASFIPGRTAIQCSARYKRIQPGLIKGAWTKEEDELLIDLYNKLGKNWSSISKQMPQRTGKQIRDRFLNTLDNNLDRGKFRQEEDELIIKWYKVYGNSWSKIAKKLKGRTGDMVKNRFYSSLKSKVNLKKRIKFLSNKRKKIKVIKENSEEEKSIFVDEKKNVNIDNNDISLNNNICLNNNKQSKFVITKECNEFFPKINNLSEDLFKYEGQTFFIPQSNNNIRQIISLRENLGENINELRLIDNETDRYYFSLMYYMSLNGRINKRVNDYSLQMQMDILNNLQNNINNITREFK